MKKAIKYIALSIGMSILLVGILFLLKPHYWLGIVKPFDYEILMVESSIQNKNLHLDFQVIISEDYFLPILLDSIEYKVKMDGTLFSKGLKIFPKKHLFDAMDTIQLPLNIDLEVIRGIIKNNQNQDSLLLEIDITNYLELPLAGNTEFTIPIRKKIPTPNPPKFKVLSIEKKFLKLHDAQYEIYFQLDNPNHYEINIQQINALVEFPSLF